MSFHVGQKVVCVKTDEWRNAFGAIADGPGHNEIVTIRGFDTSEVRGLLLEEWRRPYDRYSDGTERGYNQCRFRPIVENKSSVSFTMGADPESERWDNRVKIPAKA